ncbi:MAG: phosphoribosyl-AMP cyclohydrolase [Thiohalomonadales bacterium]
MQEEWLEAVRWDDKGLVPVIAQDYQSSKVLMFAWMNRQALQLTVKEQRAIYWSRSRQKLWRKGEESGHIQQLKDIRLDCDNDVILLSVQQIGGIACHTGHERCFFQQLQGRYEPSQPPRWQEVEPVVVDPSEIYK